MADMSQGTSPYVFCVNNPILFIDKFGLDTARIQLKQVTITGQYIKKASELFLYFGRLTPIGKMGNEWLGNRNRVDNAGSFQGLAYNSIVRNSDKSVLEGDLIEKLKKDPAFQTWRKQILKQYKTNPLIKNRKQVIKFGGEKFFSMNGDTELKLSIRNAGVSATFSETNGVVTINYHMEDTLDLDYQRNRGAVYNGVNGFLKPTWIFIGGNPAMKVQGDWSETIKK